MKHCMHCGREIPGGARFCPDCGTEVSSLSQLPTEVASPVSRRAHSTPSHGVGRIDSSGGEFMPGQVLDERYRVIGLLGRGGMGEVYRADDLKLGQAVALKFLPRAFAGRRDMLDRLHGEVRNARQVSHPNVCRVYDLGEIEGRPFLTMEYVDGEDLGTLLRRIGRLPRAKADQVGRQMCAGLAAAHDRGVIHRDLKPSNVMLDGDGRVRITDFGLAVRDVEDTTGEIAGTPAYMAPEQFDGKPATVQSDLYSLGLILYEIHTGKRALEAQSYDQWRSQHRSGTPSSPSTVEADVDESVSRAVLRCLEKDPLRRPSSALQLAASLPGGDPLAAALAAGETPSPQMVATAGGEGAIAPSRAWAMLGGVLLLLAAAIVIMPWSSDLALGPRPLSAPVLEARAREVRAQLGYREDSRDHWYAYTREYRPLKYVADHEVSTRWRRDYRSRGIPWLFEYRESPRRLVPVSAGAAPSHDDPPMNVSGMTTTTLHLDGRLREFLAVPPVLDTAASGSVAEPDWGAAFAAARLDSSQFVRVEPRWVPPVAFDRRAEWVRVGATTALDSLRVSAASWRGRLVTFYTLGPWSRPERGVTPELPLTAVIGQWAVGITLVGVSIGAAVIARRNLKLGRGDGRGARRVLAAYVVLSLGYWLCSAHHVADLGDELQMLLGVLGISLFNGLLLTLLYLAVEPMVRRRTPHLLIGWARLLEGRWRDPRVGFDVLTGMLFALFNWLIYSISNALPTWIPLAQQTTVPPDPDLLAGGPRVFGAFFNFLSFGMLSGFSIFAAYSLLRALVRKPALAAAGFAVIGTLLSLGGENALVEIPGAVATGVLFAVVTVRFGLLPAISMLFTLYFARFVPFTFDPTWPTFFASMFGIAVITALAILAFRTSLGSRPVFQFTLED